MENNQYSRNFSIFFLFSLNANPLNVTENADSEGLKERNPLAPHYIIITHSPWKPVMFTAWQYHHPQQFWHFLRFCITVWSVRLILECLFVEFRREGVLYLGVWIGVEEVNSTFKGLMLSVSISRIRYLPKTRGQSARPTVQNFKYF